MNTRNRPQNNVARWLPVGAAGGLLLAVIVAGVISGSGGDENAGADGTTTGPIISGPADTGPFTTETYVGVETVATSAPIVKVPLDRTLSDGVAGDDVQRVQQRLKELAFDPGPIDGIYGLMTMQSVWAFETLVLGVTQAESNGRVTPEIWDRMQDPIQVKPRRPTNGAANHVEIYLPEQALVVFHADVPVLVTHISSGQLDENGDPKRYFENATYDTDGQGNELEEPVTKAITALAKTPGGIFTIDRMVVGKRTSPLGGMYDPVYFNYGIAIHGALGVPNFPDSHGCVRIPLHISSYFQTLVKVDERIFVWNGKKEPEDQTKKDRLPSFDAPDPNATTTTSTTTSTTTTSTTIAPVVTQAPATTTPSATSTSTTTTIAPATTTSTTVVPVDDL